MNLQFGTNIDGVWLMVTAEGGKKLKFTRTRAVSSNDCVPPKKSCRSIQLHFLPNLELFFHSMETWFEVEGEKKFSGRMCGVLNNE